MSKRKILKITALVACVMMIACHRGKEETKADAGEPGSHCVLFTDNTMNSVPLDTARMAIANYARVWNEILATRDTFFTPDFRDNPPLAFRIGADDMKGVLGIDDRTTSTSGARAYLGVINSALHIYLVSIDVHGRDSLGPAGKVFDLTTPCPRTCDRCSPLYKIFAATYTAAATPTNSIYKTDTLCGGVH